MVSFKRLSLILMTGCAASALAACDGASDIASPGTGGDVIINPTPSPSPSPSPTPTPGDGLVEAADGCPDVAGLSDDGTITVPTGTWRVCTLPATFTASATLPKVEGLLYRMDGRVDVGEDQGAVPQAGEHSVTLKIEPGVIIYAGTGVSWLAVNRGNKINAVGTATAPIVFTSRQNVLGQNNDNSSGQWGGVVLLGRAPVTDCTIAPNATPGTAECERQTEGAVDPAVFGGATANDNSGKMSYVQIRYSGYVLSADNELQSLTLEGVGNQTQIDHIQSVNSSDDAVEMFGGQPRLKHLVFVGAEDDNLDTDTGVQALVQYVIAVQRQGVGDTMAEVDSDNAVDGNTPRQHTKISNFTFVQRSTSGSDKAALLIRGGADYTLVNGVLVSPDYPCFSVSRPATIQETGDDELGPPQFESVAAQCGSPAFLGANGVTNEQIQSIFNLGSNNSVTFTPSLVDLYVNGANEAAVPVYNPTQLSDFFDNVSYIGAVRDADDTWYQGWTCNSAAASFGDDAELCTSIPTS